MGLGGRTWRLALVVALAACGKGEADGPRGRVRLAVSVDWEGAYLSDEGLDAIDGFRERNPGVPLTHFVTPSYFTKPGADRAAVATSIAAELGPGDELALHLHGWRSLIEAAGVGYRAAPSFLAAELMTWPDGDQGFEIELDAYEADELARVLATSRALFAEAKLTLGPSFRAGGWLAAPALLGAVRAAGFTVDSSSTDPAWLTEELPDAALPARIRALWPTVDRTTQPFAIATPAGELVELPMTGAMADYLSADEMTAHLRWALAELARHPERDVFVQLGFHQENAEQFAPRLEQALEAVRAEARGRIVHETIAASAAAWQASRKAR